MPNSIGWGEIDPTKPPWHWFWWDYQLIDKTKMLTLITCLGKNIRSTRYLKNSSKTTQCCRFTITKWCILNQCWCKQFWHHGVENSKIFFSLNYSWLKSLTVVNLSILHGRIITSLVVVVYLWGHLSHCPPKHSKIVDPGALLRGAIKTFSRNFHYTL